MKSIKTIIMMFKEMIYLVENYVEFLEAVSIEIEKLDNRLSKIETIVM